MAIGYSPKIVTEGLALYYDVGNVKSYKGEPTTNIVAGTNAIYTVAGTYTTNTTVDGVRVLENDQVNNSHVMWNGATGFIVTCSAGAYITVSAEYKTNCTVRMRFRDNPYDSQYDIDGGNIATISTQDVDINTNGEWKRYSLTAQTSTANPDLWWYLVDYRNNNEFGRVEIRNWQIEVKSHATPFVNGTRSATQGLLDLTGNSTIDIGGTSFNTSSEIFFDGTDDWLLLTRRQYAAAEAWTAELIINPSDAADTSWNGIFGGDLGVGGYWMFHGGGNLTYYEGYWNPTTRIAYTGLLLGNHFPANTNKHLTITYDGAGRYNIYINGAQAEGFNWTHTGTYSLDLRYVGGPAARYGTVQVPLLKMYDGTLTPTQISSNFNAIRSRFNI